MFKKKNKFHLLNCVHPYCVQTWVGVLSNSRGVSRGQRSESETWAMSLADKGGPLTLGLLLILI